MADKKISALTAATTPLAGTEVLPIVQSGSTVKVANNDLRPKQIQSNATSGVLQVTGPAAAATRVMTVPDANFTVARTDATNTFGADQNVTGTLTATYVRSNNASGTAQVTARNVNDYFGFYTQSGQSKMFFYDAYNNVDLFNVSSSTKDLTLNAGNLVIGTSGKGIDFSATAGTGTSELLDDYEEGTWTPVISATTTNPTITYNVQVGTYTKIGNVVTLQFRINISANTGGSGLARITGLPFAGQSGSGTQTQITSLSSFSVMANYNGGFVEQNQAWIYLCDTTGGTFSITSLGTGFVNGSISYIAA